MKRYESNTWKRISKNEARKFYESGADVYTLPCKIDPDNHGGRMQGPLNTFYPFDTVVFNATRYSCDNTFGKYLSFYVRK